MNKQELSQQIETLQAQIKELKAQKKGAEPTVSFKVSTKGAVSVYGLGRFPVTLYLSQWNKLFKVSNDLAAFIEMHKAEIKEKPVSTTATSIAKTEGQEAA